MDKVMSPSFIPRIPAVLREVMAAVDTDMTTRQLLELAGSMKTAQENGLETDMVPGYPLYIEDISYWIPDIEELQYAMATGLGVNVDSRLKSRVRRIADEYSASIPENMKNSRRYEYGDDIKTPSSYDSEISKPSTYDSETSTSSTYDGISNSSTYDSEISTSSTYDGISNSSTYDTEISTPTYSETPTYDTSSYDTSTTSSYSENNNSSYSTYDDYKPSRPTYSDYAPEVENIRISEDYSDDVPTRGGDTYKER